MLRLIGIVLSIGLADSLDPTTLGPGLYLSMGPAPARRVLQFTVGVLLVMVAGGLLVILGPGQLLLHLVPRPRKIVEHWLEVAVGVILILGSIVVWGYRRRLSQRDLFRSRATPERSSVWLGAGVMTVNLPVAFPYFAAMAAIIGSGRSLASQAGCIVLYSLCFVAPLLAIVALLALVPDRAEAIIGRVRAGIQRNWAGALAAVLILAGIFVIALGLVGISSAHRHHRFTGAIVAVAEQPAPDA